MTASTWLYVIGFATLAGLDVASVLQGLASRPLIVGTVTGALVGDLETGLRTGALLELFALDVVPIGASRYPDFSAATAAAVTYAAGTIWMETVGVAVAMGLALATLGGASIPVVRRWNARVVRAAAGGLAAGQAPVVARVHWVCLGHDVVRSAFLAVGGVTAAWVVSTLGLWPPPSVGPVLTLIAIGGATWAAMHGAAVSAGTGVRARWLFGGLAAGALVVLR